MKKSVLIAVVTALSLQLNGQTATTGASGDVKHPYFATSSELIFSWGNVEVRPTDNVEPNSIVRFTCFLHLQEQLHYDFSEKAGFYTGLSLRNVGLINDLNDTVKVKQRVYTLGIPVALKVGDMKGTYLALGAEAEFAFAYKQKVFVNDEKNKTVIWFSDRTNIFLPSVFAEIHTKSHVYLKFKYYLTDFLTENNQKLNVDGLDYHPTQSQMIYMAIGATIPEKWRK